MSAVVYRRSKNFQVEGGNSTDHGALNAEFDALASAIATLSARLDKLLKDDGTLEPGIVLKDALSNEVLRLMTGTDVVTVQGPKGDVGASFRADYRGLMAERALFDDRSKGFCFLAMDAGQLFFKLSDASGHWGLGFVFAKGDKGDTGAPGAKGERGADGASGAVVTVDTSTQTQGLIGRSQVSAQLVLESGRLSIRLRTM